MQLQADVAVIGGGAAGFYFTAQLLQQRTDLDIVILEKTTKLLSKVAVSGGGRCNVTHHCLNPKKLAKKYPRGEKALRQIFKRYSVADTINWFEQQGVPLKTEADGRMFPKSNSSQSIVDALHKACQHKQVNIRTKCGVSAIRQMQAGFELQLSDGNTMLAKYVFVATGGFAKPDAYNWLQQLGLNIIEPVPSLFTFNLPGNAICKLQGISVADVVVSLPQAKLKNRGPLLITHWGLSGPAVLGLSAWGARALYDLNYKFEALVDWLPNESQEVLSKKLLELKNNKDKKLVFGSSPVELPRRLWEYFCLEAEVADTDRWLDLPNKKIHKLIQLLKYGSFPASGKTTYKEEFVTCGGVDLAEIDTDTMESNQVPGLYFAGEVLNIDGITGGFNFQAAWSTAYTAACAVARQ